MLQTESRMISHGTPLKSRISVRMCKVFIIVNIIITFHLPHTKQRKENKQRTNGTIQKVARKP